MTMIIKFRGDCFVNPSLWCKLDLDSERDRETFENIDFMMAAEHLHEGESIEIVCIERDDDKQNI